MSIIKTTISAAMILSLAIAAAEPGVWADDPAKSPDQDLPPHITRLTLCGERADFSHDGKRVLFLEKTFGDVYEVDLATRPARLVQLVGDDCGYQTICGERIWAWDKGAGQLKLVAEHAVRPRP